LTGKENPFQQAAQVPVNLGNAEIQFAVLIIVTGEEYSFLVSEQTSESSIELGCALLGPVGRNTVPTMTLAALTVTIYGGVDPALVVAPAGSILFRAEDGKQCTDCGWRARKRLVCEPARMKLSSIQGRRP
jgi:mannose-1-phosphate guanylyltransferase/mannose-6-phosphate isomerase